MIRARFYIGKDDCDNDYRPVKWPIKYPYWCSAESSNSDACMRDGVIRKVKAKIEEYGGLLLADIPDRITSYEIGRDAFESKEEALKHAEERRTHLIESIKKQLNELENLKFECDD